MRIRRDTDDLGAALTRRGGLSVDLLVTWLDRHRPRRERAIQEADIERKASRYTGAMPFPRLSVPSRADRGHRESNSIASASCLTGGPGQEMSRTAGSDRRTPRRCP